MFDLIGLIRESYPQIDADFVEKAYEYAKKAHSSQLRESGEPYIIHPKGVVTILLEMGLDTATIAAGLLHDVLEDTEISEQKIRTEFGEEVFNLVDGVTKLSKLNFNSREEQQAESLRKMFLAMAKDIRVLLIKLADRLHNMRTLGYRSTEDQVRVATETLEIYAPLANRMGIYRMKWELEDLSFKAIYPVEYQELAKSIAANRSEREHTIQDIIVNIKEHLDEAGIECTIDGRPKHLYSIYKKMTTQNKPLEEIYDLTAVRIIVNTIRDCYGALGIVHTIWKPLPGRFKDYISLPKANLYQSLHTTVIGKQGIPFEIQIRTAEMHNIAEYGIAAHWKYKENLKDDADLEAKMTWLRQVLEWQTDTSDSAEFINTLKIDLFSDEVFVFTPKGDVYSFPRGATPIDFAYRVHSAIGNNCMGAKINGKIVPLDSVLENGDIVSIITSKAKGPSRDWLNIAKTPQARNKIRAWFKKERREENVLKGSAMLKEAAKRYGYTPGKLLREDWLQSVGEKLSFPNVEDLYSALGYGGITTGQIMNRLIEYLQKETDQSIPAVTTAEPQPDKKQEKPAPKVKQSSSSKGIVVKGERNMLVRFAHCCNPLPGDEIVGLITRGRGVSVHRADCTNMRDIGIDPERFILVEWESAINSSFNAQMILTAQDSEGLFSRISNAIMNLGLSILEINARINNKTKLVNMNFTVKISNKEQLDKLISSLSAMPEVLEVYRASA